MVRPISSRFLTRGARSERLNWSIIVQRESSAWTVQRWSRDRIAAEPGAVVTSLRPGKDTQ